MADNTTSSLPPQQQAFVREYLKDLNATRAAIRAGYSEDTARQQGSRLLSNVDIQTALSFAMAERARRAKISQTWVIKRLKKEAVRNDENASHSARINALKLLGQHIGMFGDREPLDVFLALLGPELAERVRGLLGDRVQRRGDTAGSGDGRG